MLKLIGLFVGTLALSVLAVACSDNGDGNGGDVPQPTNTVDAEAAIRAEAERLCPNVDQDFFDGCVSRYVDWSKSSRPALLCVNEEDGRSYLANPGATPDPELGEGVTEASEVGDECREPGHTAVGIVGGDN